MRVDEIRMHLTKQLLPFWMKLKDESFGGYYGEVDYNLKINQKADKGCILNSRILWFFSNAYITLKDEACLIHARHAYEFLKNTFYDMEKGGVYWSVTYDGKPRDDSKHTYNQAFAIYALASYYGATKEEEALKLAYGLVEKVETICKDEGGYLEAFNRSFEPECNEKLSENGVMASRTMNTLLHIFEAYTELYCFDKKPDIAQYMREMLDTFADKIYNPERRRLEVFFDKDWNSLIDLCSYGHDIEASWLIDRGVEVLGDKKYMDKIFPITKELAAHIYEVALDGASLFNECEEDKVDRKKVWWVQAEAMLGFLNAYEKDNSREDYLVIAGKLWDYIKQYFIDQRQDSEWYNELNQEGEPDTRMELVGPWKCPYHNGRMCLEVINKNIAF